MTEPEKRALHGRLVRQFEVALRGAFLIEGSMEPAVEALDLRGGYDVNILDAIIKGDTSALGIRVHITTFIKEATNA